MARPMATVTAGPFRDSPQTARKLLHNAEGASDPVCFTRLPPRWRGSFQRRNTSVKSRAAPRRIRVAALVRHPFKGVILLAAIGADGFEVRAFSNV